MGQKEGGERACHRLHNERICGYRDRGKDGIYLPAARSSISLSTITCLRYHYPPSRFGNASEQESCSAVFQAQNG